MRSVFLFTHLPSSPTILRSPFFSFLVWRKGGKQEGKGRRERTRVRNDRKKSYTERAREGFKPSRGRRDRKQKGPERKR